MLQVFPWTEWWDEISTKAFSFLYSVGFPRAHLMVLGLEGISVCSKIISLLKYTLLLLNMQQSCCLKTDFKLPHEILECIVLVAFKVFSSLDFMLFLYEKLIFSPAQSGFFFLLLFLLTVKAVTFYDMDRNILVRAGWDCIVACHVLVCSWSILISLKDPQFVNSFQQTL